MQSDAISNLAVLKDRSNRLKLLAALQAKNIEILENNCALINKRSQNIDATRLDYEQAVASVKTVLSKIDQVKLELDAPPRVKRMDDEGEVTVVKPHKYYKVQMASLGATGIFLAVLLLTAMLEFRLRRVETTDQVVQGLGLQVVGTLPAAPRHFGRRLLSSRSGNDALWHSLLAESVDSARTLLLRARAPDRSRW